MVREFTLELQTMAWHQAKGILFGILRLYSSAERNRYLAFKKALEDFIEAVEDSGECGIE